ncbi:MAG TPA: cation diffusion facilitator family transporter [Rhizomicrobium sp.]|jgi:cobalt-zinc-cadmium efflux system protein|nr:cation diffusion facilitator family transporter [Rhizomicrobium sp.]
MHSHDHAHDHHGHGHSHAPASFGVAFAVGIVLNLGFVVVGATAGVIGHSMALIADAGHNLGDVLGLAVAWTAAMLARRAPSSRFTYGLRSSSILAALFNAVFLLIATGAIALEAILRFGDPQPVAGRLVMLVAAIGIAINAATAMLFLRGRHDDLNIRGAFLHMAGDAAVSAGVVLAGVAIVFTGRNWIDPAVSLLVCFAIVAGTWNLLRDALRMTLHGVPPGIDPVKVSAFLAQCPGVCAIHDLHIWPMSTTETALTAHLVILDGHPGDAVLHGIADELRHHYGIAHATLQVETDANADCALADAHVV